MMRTTKKELADALVKTLGISHLRAFFIVRIFFDLIKKTLAAGEPVKLSGFGNFVPRDKKKRIGRNPKTGEEAVISKRRVVVFKAGSKLKNHIQKK